MPWAIKFVSNSPLDGHREHLMGAANVARPLELSGYTTMVFASRAAAREHIKNRYGYIAHRPDLRQAPHCWKMPRAVKVAVSVIESR